MGVASRDNGAPTGPARKAHARTGLVLALVFPLAVIPFATVHPGVRETVAVAMVGIAIAASWSHGRRLGAIGTIAALALGASALVLIPVGPGLRESLQPGLAELVETGLSAGAATTHPLALDPPRAWSAWAFTAAAFAVFLAATHGSRRAALAQSGVLVGTGVVVTLWAWAQWLGDAPSIGWISGVGSPGRGSFGPFVNPNHAGAALAALLPLALARARRDGGLWLAASGTLAAGVVSTGSRGAVVAAIVGVIALFLIAGSPRVRGTVAAVLAVSAAALAIIGPSGALAALGDVLGPDPESAGLDTDRLAIWSDATALIGGAPLTGLGAGGFAAAWPVVKTSPTFARVAHAHQEPLQALIEHGAPVVGLLLLAAAVLAWRASFALREAGAQRRLWISAYSASALALLSASMVDFPLRVGAVGALGALVVGTVAGLSTGPRRGGRAPLVLAGLLSAAAGIAGWAMPSAEDALDRADQAWSAGDAVASEAAAREALALRPVDANAWMRLARASGRQGDLEGATEALKMAAACDPTLPWPWLALARTETGDASSAAWRRLLALDAPGGGIPDAWVREALTHGGDPVAAALDRIERPERLCHAAAVLAREDPISSELLFEVAVPAWPDCASEYAVRLVSWGRPHEALGALQGRPPTCGVRRARGHALSALERWDDAIPELDAALRCGPKDPLLRLSLARARLATGDRAALGILEALVAEDPAFASARRALWRELRARGRSDEARTHLQWLVDHGGATEQDRALLDAP